MNAQDDVADCFEYFKCNLNAKNRQIQTQDNLLMRFKLKDYQNLTKTKDSRTCN